MPVSTHRFCGRGNFRGLRTIILWVAFFSGASPLPDAIRTEDELYSAIFDAGINLAAGMKRGEVRARLEAVILRQPESEYVELATKLTTDIENSVSHPPSRLPGVNMPMMETTVSANLLARVNRRAWPFFIEKYPDDPTAHLLRADRDVIESLIPMLADFSPTRSAAGELMRGDLPMTPRVCDYALAGIELHSHCLFHFSSTTHGMFHDFSAKDREEIVNRIGEWWRDQLARREIEQGKDAGAGVVWAALVNCSKAKTSVFAIPGLGLALSQTKNTGARWSESGGEQSYSYADTATERLQHLTKMDFGYQAAGTPEARTAAIANASAWWVAEGRRKYTFEYREKIETTPEDAPSDK